MFKHELISVGELSIELTFKSTLKNLYIRINSPDGNVTVSTPASLSIEKIKNILLSKMSEIIKARRKFQAQPR